MTGKYELLVVAAQGAEEVEDLGSRCVGGRTLSRSILLNAWGKDGTQAEREAFFGHDGVCGSGPSKASTQQQHRIGHAQHPLDLAAEVGGGRGCRRC